ncbi:MAG: AsmA family protein [Bryobacteraceae bacterium]
MPRRIWLGLVWTLLLFLVASVAAPFLSADRFGKRIQRALETALGRKVEIGQVRFHLFRGPGFSLHDVVIHEDPAFGIEPMVAWVESVEANPSLPALWRGRLEFSSLRLGNPVVNLVKLDAPANRWNFQPLMTRSRIASLPHIAVRGGRINFKFGDTKSVFYVTNADLDVTPLSAGMEWSLRFSGEPARTDRAARGLGSFAGNGRWKPDRLSLDLELERSPIGEIITLVHGRDAGIHGVVSARLRLAGPLDDVQIAGRLHLAELHRWDQMPMKGDGWNLPLKGRLNLGSQRLELESGMGAKDVLPLQVKYHVTDYLSSARWGLEVAWSQLPVEPLTPIARHMGASWPEALKVSGTLDGALRYASGSGFQGSVALNGGSIGYPGSPAVRLGKADVVFERGHVRLAPTDLLVETETPRQAKVEADYWFAGDEMDLALSSDSMGVKDLPLGAARIATPLLEPFSKGYWKGRVRYQRSAQTGEKWTGRLQLADVEVAVPGLADPVEIRSAAARVDGTHLVLDKIDAQAGNVMLAGDYRYEPGAARPHRFRLQIPEADTAELERLLMPTLVRREGLLRRAFSFGRASLPEWLAERNAEGQVRIASLKAGEQEFRNVSGRVVWDAAQVTLADLRADTEGGSIWARVSANVRGAAPAYRANFVVGAVDWSGGAVDAEGWIEASGTGRELIARLRSEGSFSGRDVELGALAGVKTVSGCYRFEASPRAPNLRFTELQIAVGDELFLGRGASQSDGRLLLQLANGSRQMRISGTLAQLTVEPALGSEIQTRK